MTEQTEFQAVDLQQATPPGVCPECAAHGIEHPVAGLRGIAISGHLDTLDTSPSSSQSRAHNPRKPEQGSEVSKCPRCAGDGCEWCTV